MFLTRPSVSQSVHQSIRPDFLVSAAPLKPLNRISCNCKGHTGIQMRISTGYIDSIFFLGVTPFFELRYSAKMKDTCTTETVCQRNSSETAQKNFLKLCSNKGYNVQMCISTGKPDSIFFLGVMPLFELRNLAKIKDTTQNSLSVQLH